MPDPAIPAPPSTVPAGRQSGSRPGVFALLLLPLVGTVSAADLAPAENARIEYLIAAVGALPSAQFVRNGTAYDAKAAVEHLRLKLRFAGTRIKTAEDFIRVCASESSVSGKPYEIRFADGRAVPSAQFMRQKLLEFDRQNGGSSALPRGVMRDR